MYGGFAGDAQCTAKGPCVTGLGEEDSDTQLATEARVLA